MPLLNSIINTLLPVQPDLKIVLNDVLPPMTGVRYSLSPVERKQAPKHYGWGFEPISRPGWEKPVFDLVEIAKASQVESYIRLSIDKHREHVLRHGWSFVGKNQTTVSHIYKRLHEISEGMGKPVEEQIRQAITNFIKYHNAFLCKTRDRNKLFKSRFGIRRGKTTGLFSLNPVAMRFRRSERNQILEWYQVVDHTEEMLKPEDVVHIPFSREDGYILGTPYLLQVLDDVQFLRRIEEIAGKLLHKFAYPLYHHKIGDKDNPPDGRDDGTSDIGDAYGAVSGMAPEGHLVTSYLHSIEVIGAQSRAIDLKPYLEYAENRVIAGLNLSSLDLGRGDSSNRNTATTLSKGMSDRCGEYQEVFADLFTFYVLDELLLEGGFELNPDNRVYMFFPEIDRESKRAEENHYADLFVKNLVTHSEWRAFSGREPFLDEQWKDTQFERITKPELNLKASIKAEATSNAIANKSKPSNQHGTKSTKTRVTKDMLAEYAAAQSIQDISALLEASMQAGIKEYNDTYAADVYLGPGILSAFMQDCAEPYFTKNKSDNMLSDYHANTLLTAAHNYAYMRAGQIHGKYTHAVWKLEDTACAACRSIAPIRIRRFTLGQIVPIHDDCVSGIEFINI